MGRVASGVAVIVVSVLLFVIAGGVLASRWTHPQWVGRTRVMERQPNQQPVQVYNQSQGPQRMVQERLTRLVKIAQSKEVVAGAVKSLSEIGVEISPEVLRASLKVEPVTDTQIIQIEVVSSDPEEAKACADVVAAELQSRMRGKAKDSPIKMIDPAYAYPLSNYSALRSILGGVLGVGSFVCLVVGIVMVATGRRGE